MSQESTRYNTVHAIVLNYIARRQEKNLDRYEMYKLFLINRIRLLKMDTKFGIEVLITTADHECNGQIIMPDDFVKYRVVSVIYRGELWTLTYDPNMVTDEVSPCGENLDSIPSTGITDSIYIQPTSRVTEVMNSRGGGFNFKYIKEDRKAKKIFVDPAIYGEKIIIQYVSIGSDINDETVVPAPWVNYLMMGMDIEELLGKNTDGRLDNAIDNAERRAAVEAMKATNRDSDLNYRRLQDIFASQNTLLKYAGR